MASNDGQIRRTSVHLINEEPLQILPSVACAIGIDEAIFLQRLQFWLRNSRHIYDGRIWIYNSLPEWGRQLPFFPRRTLQRIIANLKESGILLVTSVYNKHPSDRTNWYSIDLDVFDAIMEQWHLDNDEEHFEGENQDDFDDDGAGNQRSANVAPPSAKMAHHSAKMAHHSAKMAPPYNEQTDLTQTALTTEVRRVAQPPLAAQAPAAVSPPAKPKVSDHPAIQAYRALHERYPTKAQMKLIAESDPPLDNWVRAIRLWAARGRNITNIEEQLKWAKNPKLMDERPGAKAPPNRGILAAADEVPQDDEADIERLKAWKERTYGQKGTSDV